MTKSYVKVYGPPLAEALRALERVALEMPEVRYYTTTFIYSAFEKSGDSENGTVFPFTVPEEQKGKLISKSGQTLGEYDFFYEWVNEPNWKRLENLIEKIDEVLKPLGCKYTITTK